MKKKKTTNRCQHKIKILKLNNKDFKVALTKMLQQAIKNMLKTNGEKTNSTKKQKI